MYRLAQDALAAARARGPAELLHRAGDAAVWRRLFFGGFQTRDWKPILAHRYLRGEGLEIGALHRPLPVAAGTKVRFVDRLDCEGLRRHYPELAGHELVPVDIVDDGERLSSVPPASQDFIVASHFLEHCENPLGAMRAHLDRLKPGGLLFYAIPDKRMCFDWRRPNTAFDHLTADDTAGPEVSRQAHYRDWAERVLGKSGAAADAAAGELMARRFNIHFHCWDRASLRTFFAQAQGYLDDGFRLVEFRANGAETIVILERGR